MSRAITGQPPPGEEIWRLRDGGRVQWCELRDDTKVGALQLAIRRHTTRDEPDRLPRRPSIAVSFSAYAGVARTRQLHSCVIWFDARKAERRSGGGMRVLVASVAVACAGLTVYGAGGASRSAAQRPDTPATTLAGPTVVAYA